MKSEETSKKASKATTSPDESMERDVKEAIKRSLGDKIHDLKVSVKKGAVTLRGHVDDAAQIAGITAIAERIKGVMDIENKITASSPETSKAGAGATMPAHAKKSEQAAAKSGGCG